MKWLAKYLSDDIKDLRNRYDRILKDYGGLEARMKSAEDEIRELKTRMSGLSLAAGLRKRPASEVKG